jgi:hypothetical protein
MVCWSAKLTRLCVLSLDEIPEGDASHRGELVPSEALRGRIASVAAPVHDDTEIEAAISLLGRQPGSGLPCMPDNFIEITTISLAARNNVPAVYQTPIIARDGGLLSYGAVFQDIFHRSARYVDNIPGILKIRELMRHDIHIKGARAASG